MALVIISVWDISQEQPHPRLLVAIVVIVALVSIVAVVIWVLKIDTDKPHKIMDMKVKTSLVIVAVVVTLIIDVGGFVIADKQDTVNGKHDADIFTRAVDQVANQDIEIRLGGLTSLESLSYESHDEYKRVWEYLGDFLRAPPKLNESDKNEVGRKDIEYIIDMLKDRRSREKLKELKTFRLPLYGTNLQGANLGGPYLLVQGGYLGGAYLAGADLSDAYLEGADLTFANLPGAYLRGAFMEGTKLHGADLQGAYLQGAYLRGADFSEADLEGAYLQGVEGGHLQGSPYLESTNLQGTNLEGAYLQGAYLQGTNLEGTNLEGAYLQGAYLRGTNLQGANLRWVNLYGANLDEANLQGAYLEGADFSRADLHGTLFGGLNSRPQNLGSVCKNHTFEQLQYSYIEGSLENVNILAGCGLTKTIPYEKWKRCKDPSIIPEELSETETSEFMLECMESNAN